MALDVLPMLAFLAKYVVGLILFVSGLLKLRDIEGFYKIFLQFEVVSGKIAKLGVFIVIFGEIFVGAMILLEYMPALFSSLGFFLILMSTYALSNAYKKGNNLENCGCFGTSLISPVNKTRLMENVALLMIASYLFWFHFFV